MDKSRRSARHLDPKDDSSQGSAVDPLRALTADSGRGSMATSERPTTLDSRATNTPSSVVSSDTPLNVPEHTIDHELEDDEPVQIHLAPVFGNRCYEQAYVSHVDHPSAFFLQMAHSEDKYKKLNIEMNEYYSKIPKSEVALSWKCGDYCIAKHKDKKFYRARIIDTSKVNTISETYDVVFLDYGNWDRVPSTDIHTILRRFAILPAQAIPCSLTKSLPPTGVPFNPRNNTWSDHPESTKKFEKLVLDKYVDVTFQMKTDRDYWPLAFVDLQISATKLNIREQMLNEGYIRDVPNEKIYLEFNHLFKKVDYLIYSIPYEEEDDDD